MKHYIGQIDVRHPAVLAKLREFFIHEVGRMYPVLNFYAVDEADASRYFIDHYRCLFRFHLEPGEFTITEQAA